MKNTVEGHSDWSKKRVSRRDVLRASAELALGAAIVGTGVGVILYGERNFQELTDEQKKALKLFETADQSNFVHNIQVIGQDVGNDRKAFLRNKPKVPSNKDDLGSGKKVGELKVGGMVDLALVVMGNRINVPFDKKMSEKWLAIKQGNNVLFANSQLFAHSDELDLAVPIDLSK